MKNMKDKILDDEMLGKINGGTAESSQNQDDQSLKRVKCPCGEIFMANIHNLPIICPNCHKDITSIVLGTENSAPAEVASTGTGARMA
ncbi:MAG: hypothetical protein K6G27_10215 [Lachnospiraceae bacterium]|nr:hypothetical protein [Lachnospiraceae bacterium]